MRVPALATLMRRKEPDASGFFQADTWKRCRLAISRPGTVSWSKAVTGMAAASKVVSGVAEVDSKALTGESQLLPKREGDPVFASSVVVEGQIVVEVEHAGMNTRVAKNPRES